MVWGDWSKIMSGSMSLPLTLSLLGVFLAVILPSSVVIVKVMSSASSIPAGLKGKIVLMAGSFLIKLMNLDQTTSTLSSSPDKNMLRILSATSVDFSEVTASGKSKNMVSFV